MTVRELEERMDGAELADWLALFQLEHEERQAAERRATHGRRGRR
ncbi:MAG TPA: hypothetical protein VFS08_10415 [Gemmatimonadaceae bacterium]|nr:hypothetical protein [Gemmatimonadaceae bacterium]